MPALTLSGPLPPASRMNSAQSGQLLPLSYSSMFKTHSCFCAFACHVSQAGCLSSFPMSDSWLLAPQDSLTLNLQYPISLSQTLVLCLCGVHNALTCAAHFYLHIDELIGSMQTTRNSGLNPKVVTLYVTIYLNFNSQISLKWIVEIFFKCMCSDFFKTFFFFKYLPG